MGKIQRFLGDIGVFLRRTQTLMMVKIGNFKKFSRNFGENECKVIFALPFGAMCRKRKRTGSSAG